MNGRLDREAVDRMSARSATRTSRIIRTVLTHPVAMWVKAHVRAIVWTFKGTGLSNPPEPAHVSSAVFVCLGNLCRSPFAALLATRLLADAGRTDIVCSSAGLRPSQAERSPDEARTTAAKYGIALERHVPQALTAQMMAGCDMVIVMEPMHVHHVRAWSPEYADRVFLLPLYDDTARNAFERSHIADPFGKPLAEFEQCYERIARALDGWIIAVSKAESAGASPRRRNNGDICLR